MSGSLSAAVVVVPPSEILFDVDFNSPGDTPSQQAKTSVPKNSAGIFEHLSRQIFGSARVVEGYKTMTGQPTMMFAGSAGGFNYSQLGFDTKQFYDSFGTSETRTIDLQFDLLLENLAGRNSIPNSNGGGNLLTLLIDLPDSHRIEFNGTNDIFFRLSSRSNLRHESYLERRARWRAPVHPARFPPAAPGCNARRRACLRVTLRDDGLHLTDGPPGMEVVVFDPPPSHKDAVTLVHRIGKSSIDSNRVQVPFSHIAPAAGEIWTSDITAELRVPIGRTGAKKLQMLAMLTRATLGQTVTSRSNATKPTRISSWMTTIPRRGCSRGRVKGSTTTKPARSRQTARFKSSGCRRMSGMRCWTG